MSDITDLNWLFEHQPSDCSENQENLADLTRYSEDMLCEEFDGDCLHWKIPVSCESNDLFMETNRASYVITSENVESRIEDYVEPTGSCRSFLQFPYIVSIFQMRVLRCRLASMKSLISMESAKLKVSSKPK